MFTISLKLHKVKKNKNGEYPIAFCLSRNGKRNYIYTGFVSLEKDFDVKAQKYKRSAPDFKRRNLILSEKLTRAQQINDGFIRQGGGSVQAFKDLLRGKAVNTDYLNYVKVKIAEHAETKTNTANYHKAASEAVRKFIKGKTLDFADITPMWLDRFERHLRSEGMNDGGISGYMRSIRSTYNHAIRNRQVKKENYPFDIYKISKLKSTPKSRALSKSDVRKIIEYQTTDPVLFRAKSLFAFSYFCRGMNFRDMAQLTEDNIRQGRLEYSRDKTGKFFSIELFPQAVEILEYFGGLPSETPYIFPILTNNSVTEKQKTTQIKQVLKRTNAKLKEIAAAVGIENPNEITTYYARHSFATILKKSGVGIAKISEMLGHEDLETTKTYLAKFDNSDLDDAAKNLL